MTRPKAKMVSTAYVPQRRDDNSKFLAAMDALNVGEGFVIALNGRLGNVLAQACCAQGKRTGKRFLSHTLVQGRTHYVVRIPTELPLLDV